MLSRWYHVWCVRMKGGARNIIAAAIFLAPRRLDRPDRRR
jgi:hypothetical protein